jgi:hypothetical protein
MAHASVRWTATLITSLFAALLLTAACSGGSGSGHPGCRKDADCKGSRVCMSGECQDPSPQAQANGVQGNGAQQAAAPQPPPLIQPQCQADTDCPKYHECRQGACACACKVGKRYNAAGSCIDYNCGPGYKCNPNDGLCYCQCM